MRATWATKTRDAHGYGSAHKSLRERYRHQIDGGAVVLCARCRRRILAGEPWDLGHTADRTGWTGPEHRRFNRVAGARDGAAVTNARHQPHHATAATDHERVWSRVWSWPIPADVYVDSGVVRAYLEGEARRGPRPNEPQLDPSPTGPDRRSYPAL